MGTPKQKADRLRTQTAPASAVLWQYFFIMVASDGWFLGALGNEWTRSIWKGLS